MLHPEPAVNRPGFGHIAFEVDDVHEARKAVKANGGGVIGEIVTLTTKVGSYSRGDITILDRAGLGAASCTCYKADQAAYARMMG